MKTNTDTNPLRWLALGLAATVLAACASPVENKKDEGTVSVAAPTALFSDTRITTYVDGTTPAGQKGMIQDMGTASNSAAAANVSVVPAVGNFAAYPSYWDGGIAWLMKPTGTTGYYDLSSVKTIKFKLKSASILPEELAFFLQWKSSTSGAGGEYTVALSTKGVTRLTAWNEVSISLAATGGDVPDTITTARYNHTVENFYTGSGSTHVDTPFSIKWYGSAAAQSNTGPLTAGENYEIGDIRFLDASGNPVNITTGIVWPAVVNPSTVPAAPTAASANVISLFTSSGTYTNTGVTTWKTDWSSGAAMSDDTTSVSAKTLKKLAFTTKTGYNGVDLSSVIDITGKTQLHLDYWTAEGTQLGIKVVDFGADGAYGGTDANADVELLQTVATVAQGAWTSVDLDFSTLATKAHVAQLVFVANNGADVQTYWLDNLYFH